MPHTIRRTRYGQARRRPQGWVWRCDFCDHTAILGMTPDLQVDPGAWLDAIDTAHDCEHKPTNGEQ